ncbi:MAG TPA: pyridoxal 5'-phosphate synthase glutaminase subunit PdxT [Acidimicrobiia bacterium]|nr:pyridoxal 5'-phosphate synthase glutaminase subunit PdxT [Acidimicrobiia bacterium]
MKIGVLALQGGFRPHLEALSALGADAFEVRLPRDLAVVDALVLPGGESTTVGRLLATSGLMKPLRERLGAGMPALGTCAGLILLSSEVLDGRPDQPVLGAIDLTVRRNAHGRQRDSFEALLEVDGLAGGPFPGVFIRAPGIERVGPGVDVLARLDGAPVALRQGAVTVCAFHPELSADLRFHQRFLNEVTMP